MRLIATRDTWLSAHFGEWDQNFGGAGTLRLKGVQEVALLDFDTTPVQGQRIVSAALWMHNVPETTEEEKQRLGLTDRPDCLREVGVSTVGSPWEATQATYNRAAQDRDWAFPGSKLWDVIMGNGHTRHTHGEREYQGEGWWKLDLDPAVVTALSLGLSHGLAVQSENGVMFWVAANSLVHGAEASEFAPYLEVETGPALGSVPAAPTELAVTAAPAYASLIAGAAEIAFLAPAHAFGYRVIVNGTDLPPWRVPAPVAAGARQSFVVEDLPGEAELVVEVRALDEIGRASLPVVATGSASPARELPPPLPASPFRPAPGAPVAGAALRVWAYPEVTKVDPLTGEAMLEPAADLRAANAAWDGARQRVRLPAARGEIAAFQLALEFDAPVEGVRVSVLVPTLPAEAVRLHRVWYVLAQERWQEEYAIPLAGALSLPSADNGVPGQRVQAVYVDLAVPAGAAAGDHNGTITVQCEEETLSLGLDLVVYPVTLPDRMTFNTELNCYSSPGAELGTPYFYAVHRLAHYHRCTLNVLPYGQKGTVKPGYTPRLEGAGGDTHAADWSDFDRLVGPLLDGSAFDGNPRGRTPVRVMYLPIFEHWPLSLWDYYPFAGLPEEESEVVRHAYASQPIAQAFRPGYAEAMARAVADYVAHAEARGWTGTDFQVYLNNKPNWGGTWWTLDEPTARPDWQAIRYYAEIFARGVRGATTAHLMFRGDISRPQHQYDQLDGATGAGYDKPALMDTIYYNNQIFDYPTVATRVMNRRVPDPHVYGMLNELHLANHQTVVWCLKAAVLGLNGVLPWQSIGSEQALREPDLNGLLVPGLLAGHAGPVASLRVLAMRRGAQDVELLRLLAAREGYSLDQMAALVDQKVPLGSLHHQRFVDEAAGLQFGEVSAQAFAELRDGVLQALAARAV